MKFKKRSKILAAAIAILGFSTAASITGTVAWFTASNVVSASGMYVMAEKEDGIVMANESYTQASDWKTSVVASHDGKIGENQAAFIPTSTKDSTTWAHASASNSGEKTGVDSTYSLVTPTQEAQTGVYKTTIDGNPKNIYLLNTFYLKSSTTTAVTGTLRSYVKAEVVGDSVSGNLNKALRVLVEHDHQVNIYAPLSGDNSYKVCTSIINDDNPATEEHEEKYPGMENVTAFTGSTTNILKQNVTIPANDPANPGINTFPVNVYCYFEGEDTACFSNNITATLDKLSILVKLGTQESLA